MSPPPLSERQIYTNEQINQFYNRISLPKQYRLDPAQSAQALHSDPSNALNHLAALQRHTLAAIPFENLSLHYSPHHSISLDPSHLFDKIVASPNGRGGYCMENNALFYTVLKTLGYDVVSTGARVNESVTNGGRKPIEQCRYLGWNHMINIVTIPAGSGEKYIADVGFGSGGPVRPLKLELDAKPVLNVAPAQSIRLRYDRIPDFTAKDQRVWIFEKRNSDDEEFRPCYCFEGSEFLPQDYEVMNLATSQSRMSFFTWSVVCVKWLLSDDGDSIVGDLTLIDGSLKKKVGGTSETILQFKSEADRVEALEKYMGIKLSEAEKNGIKGMVSAIAPA